MNPEEISLMTKRVVAILWDEKPRSNTEIAEKLQSQYPTDYYKMNTDLLAQSIYVHVTLPATARGTMVCQSGRYKITEAYKTQQQK